jgi:hypothetical protein
MSGGSFVTVIDPIGEVCAHWDWLGDTIDIECVQVRSGAEVVVSQEQRTELVRRINEHLHAVVFSKARGRINHA